MRIFERMYGIRCLQAGSGGTIAGPREAEEDQCSLSDERSYCKTGDLLDNRLTLRHDAEDQLTVPVGCFTCTYIASCGQFLLISGKRYTYNIHERT